MDFERQFELNRRALLDDIDRRIVVALRPYQEGLDWFLADLFRARLPADWRRRWHAFVADQSAQGRITVPQSVREMEVWIEGWAGFCGLLPRTAAAGTRSDELPGSVYIPLPPGLPMRQRIAAARARDAVARKRRYEFYEERNRQVLEAQREGGPTPAGEEETPQTPTIIIPLPAGYRTKEQIAIANAREELERLRYRRIQEERTRQVREVQRAYGALLRRGYNKERRHDPGRRLSEDPIGIAGDPSKLSPHLENAATNATDSTGQVIKILRRWITLGDPTHGEIVLDSYIANPPPLQALKAQYGNNVQLLALRGEEAKYAAMAAGDEKAMASLAEVFNAIKKTSAFPSIPVLGYFWPETFGSHCIRWMGKFLGNSNDRLKSGLFTLDVPVAGGPNHQMIIFKFPGGLMGVDNGFFGQMDGGNNDHLFDPSKVAGKASLPAITRAQVQAAVDKMSGGDSSQC